MSDHLVTIGNSFLSDDWTTTCKCGWEIGGLASHDEALAAGRKHERIVTVPSGDRPRWTVDGGDGKFANVVGTFPTCGEVFATVCSRRGGRPILAPEAHAALVAAVRSAAEVPALRERLAELEAAQPDPEFVKALEDGGLLRDEYPDQMAARSCNCESDAVCGAHRLLARYEGLFAALQAANTKKRAMRAERDQARERLAAAEALIRDARQLADNLVGCRILTWSSTVEALVRLLASPGAEAEAIARARGAREPQPTDGPDYHADHRAWEERR